MAWFNKKRYCSPKRKESNLTFKKEIQKITLSIVNGKDVSDVILLRRLYLLELLRVIQNRLEMDHLQPV